MNHFARLVLLLCLGCATALTHAQSFPNKTLRIVIGFPPGGGIDIVARILAPKLGEALGQQVLVDNRPGANGVVGMDSVAKAPPDGHTVFLGTLGNLAVNPSFYPNLPFNFETQFVPVTQLASVAFVLYANLNLAAKNAAEFIALAKSKPGQLNYSSSGNGGLPHLAGELFDVAAGIKTVHVPYKGSAAGLTDLIGGQVQFTFEAAVIGLPHLKTGKLRAVAVTGSKRLPFLPEVPTIGEALPGFEVVNWYGIVAPAGTPADAVTRWQTELARVMAQPEIRDKLVSQGADPVGNAPAEFGAFLKTESVKWARVIRQGNIKPE